MASVLGSFIKPCRDVAALLRWPSAGGRLRLLAAVLLLLFAAYQVIFLLLTAERLAAQPGGDFFALWTAARFVLYHPAAEIYRPEALKALQLQLGMPGSINYPFPYPPHFLLALVPDGLLPFPAAYAVAIGTTLALYIWATAGTRWRSPIGLAALLAPTTTITIVAGQAAFLASALLIGGFRLAGRRPVIAGVLFGLATYKPQIGVLVPVALVAARQWRAIAAACATLATLVIVSAVVFGAAAWPAWAAGMVQYSAQFAAESGAIAYLMPTVLISLRQLGLSAPWPEIGQLVAAAAAVWVVWHCFRRGLHPLAAAALFVATFLAIPHAFIYDMPPVASAVLWTIAERHRSGGDFPTSEILVLLLAMVAPIVLVAGHADLPIVPLSLILLVAMIVRARQHSEAPDAAA